MTLFRRVLTGATATVLIAGALVAGGGQAAAEQSSTCPQSASTRLLTANDGDLKLWLWQPSAQEAHVCFSTTFLSGGDIVFRTGLSGSLVPTVTPTTNDTTCPRLVHLQDPVDLMTRLGAALSSPYSVCFGAGPGSAVRITFAGPTGTVNPQAQLWLDGQRWATYYYCTLVQPNPSNCDIDNWYTNEPVRVV